MYWTLYTVYLNSLYHSNMFVYLQINVLLQAYISQLKLEGFALVSDMVYVTQVHTIIAHML